MNQRVLFCVESARKACSSRVRKLQSGELPCLVENKQPDNQSQETKPVFRTSCSGDCRSIGLCSKISVGASGRGHDSLITSDKSCLFFLSFPFPFPPPSPSLQFPVFFFNTPVHPLYNRFISSLSLLE